ncbi:hypothetical protein GNP80_05560 [Aliivibrio fischeri]|uniref:hypothetical protein n=1 Tax=Aliivibrio fischeri TaxID=668 RepID=UPI0012D8F0CE|nr:hypothetical protein [Aliivibrio fischeri]MUK91902.1 hypothetical protein [Aliivibrio fischeri]
MKVLFKDFKNNNCEESSQTWQQNKVVTEATTKLNEWLENTTTITVINIETIFTSSGSMMGSSSSKFECIRCWFYEKHIEE